MGGVVRVASGREGLARVVPAACCLLPASPPPLADNIRLLVLAAAALVALSHISILALLMGNTSSTWFSPLDASDPPNSPPPTDEQPREELVIVSSLASANDTSSTLRILCLHGHHGTAVNMSHALEPVHDRFVGQVRFDCLDGPFVGPGGRGRTWIATDNGEADANSEGKWGATLRLVRRTVKQHGPYDGLWGYSMGGATAALLLAALPPGTFRFAVLSAAYLTVRQPQLLSILQAASPLQLPTLHIHGLSDGVITADWSALLMARHFAGESSELCRHPGGHLVCPETADEFEEVVGFLARQLGRAGDDRMVDHTSTGQLRTSGALDAATEGKRHLNATLTHFHPVTAGS